MKKLIFLYPLALSLLALAGCGKPPRTVEKPPPAIPAFVKVRLPVSNNSCEIRSDAAWILQIHRADSSKEWFETDSYFQFKSGRLSLNLFENGKTQFGAYVVWTRMLPAAGRLLSLDGKPYRGELWASVDSFANLILVNQVPLEEYIKGVLPPEIGKRGPQEMEVLKAQAVAARTYTLSHLGQYPGKPWDMEADVKDQIYSGTGVEDPLASKAIDETAGEVAIYKGSFINAYYHSTCGGKTDFISEIWPNKPQEDYLVSIDDDTFCVWSKNYRWREVLTADWLNRKVSSYLKSKGQLADGAMIPITDLVAVDRAASGRLRALKVVTEEENYLILADSMRWALGRPSSPNPQAILPSTWFEIETFRSQSGQLDSVVLTGRGAGHGIGMCQTGAIGRARAGQAYKQILEHYYPGIKFERKRQWGSE